MDCSLSIPPPQGARRCFILASAMVFVYEGLYDLSVGGAIGPANPPSPLMPHFLGLVLIEFDPMSFIGRILAVARKLLGG